MQRISTVLLILLTTGGIAATGVASPQGALSASPEIKHRLNLQSRTLRSDGDRSLQRRRLLGEKAPGQLNAILVMCDFADSLMYGRYGQVPGEFPPPMQTDPYYTAHDSVYFDHMLLDVHDYFDEVSGGGLDFQFIIHPVTLNLPESMAYYGNDPQEGEQPVLLARDVILGLQNQVDFSSFDTIILAHAGAGEETDILGDSPEQIFSTYLDPDDFVRAHQDSVLDQPYIPAEGFPPGTGVDRVLILPETHRQDPVGKFDGNFGSLGVYCFEVGLHLGMLSLSDFTPSGRPDSQGIGQYGLMGYGLFVGLGYIPPHPCAFNKVLMGWFDPIEYDWQAGGTYSLTPAETPANPLSCARVNLTGQEYWLLEYRLQDPNGDRRFTFSDDKNGNGIPDYWDTDSQNGDGTPTGPFDAATDSVERSLNAEWDFAMSENSARQPGELGAGSGVYIWHIDEGVIQDVFDQQSNLFNADPARKSVDLEEADGIQDLDSREPSAYMLGGDDDSYRAEDNDAFGATTLPATGTNGGAITGIEFSNFSHVVLDSNAYTVEVGGFQYPGYAYAETMTFDLRIEPANGPVISATRDLPSGTNLRGSHVLLGNLDRLGLDLDIVLAGDAGKIFVLDGDLNEVLDHDGDPATLEPFAVGTRSGTPIPWNLPPAMGDLDGDGAMEIVLTAPDGLYAFNEDGLPVWDLDPASNGLYALIPDCSLPPILVPLDRSGTEPSVSDPVEACVAVVRGDSTFIRIISGPVGALAGEIALGSGYVASAPLYRPGKLLVAIADTIAGTPRLAVVDLPSPLPAGNPGIVFQALSGQPGPAQVTLASVPGTGSPAAEWKCAVVLAGGSVESVVLDSEYLPTGQTESWPDGRIVVGALGVGGSYVGDGILARVGTGGDFQDGWPVVPSPAAEGADIAWSGPPLVGQLLDASDPLHQYLFSTRDGRIFAQGSRGEWQPGWPIPGPARYAGSPALGHVTGGLEADLVAFGTFSRITGLLDSDILVTEDISSVTIWQDVAAPDPVWPMWGGSIWRNGSYDEDGFQPGPVVASGTGLVPGSHYCYPSPLTEGPLQVRGQVRSAAKVQAIVYNLEGQQIAVSDRRQVSAADPFSLEVELNGAVSGMYLCRMVVETDGVGSESSVVSFAVVR